MDVTETLARLRRLVNETNAITDGEQTRATDEWLAEIAPDMAALFGALDEWLERGGYLPRVWERAAHTPH